MTVNYRHTIFLEIKLHETGMTEGIPLKQKMEHFGIFPFDHKQKLNTHGNFYLSKSSRNVFKDLTN